MFKVVYDTNVIVSGLLNTEGIPALLLDLALQKKVKLFLSSSLLEECKGVLMRPKFGFSSKLVTNFLSQLKRNSTIVKPKTNLKVIKKDPQDNRILECALKAKADYIVTGNVKHFPFKNFKSIKILSPTQFWQICMKNLKF